jgi:hypothetical protein
MDGAGLEGYQQYQYAYQAKECTIHTLQRQPVQHQAMKDGVESPTPKHFGVEVLSSLSRDVQLGHLQFQPLSREQQQLPCQTAGWTEASTAPSTGSKHRGPTARTFIKVSALRC